MKEEEKKNYKTTDRRPFDSTGNVKETSEESKNKPSEQTPAEHQKPGLKEENNRRAFENNADTPKIDFATFIISLHTSTLINLGAVEDPTGQNKEINLELARQNIDMIEMIEEKTKGNLDENESNILENSLFDLRMRYVQEQKRRTNK